MKERYIFSQNDLYERFLYLSKFVEFGETELKLISESVAILAPFLSELLDNIYDRLLSFEDSAQYFLNEDESVNDDYIAVRKEHLTGWLFSIVEVSNLKDLVSYLEGVALVHSSHAGEDDRPVPPRYLVVLSNFIQNEIWSILFRALPNDLEKIQKFGLAWNKFLNLQLELFLKVNVPSWPYWDEKGHKNEIG